jgi:hypothetical protein
MKKLIRWLERTGDHLDKDYDSVVPVVGDEGKGKSTLIMELGWLWHEVDGTPNEQTVEATMDQIAWDLKEFKEAIGSKPRKSCVTVHDAARVLSRKKAMHGDQIEVEEDLLDMRFGNYLVLLGYQEFDLLPTMLATRRSKNLLYIPKRGVVHGHNEANIRERYETGDWPDPVFRDTYPSLEGKELWQAFKAEDARRKQERIQPEEEEETEADLPIPELAELVKEDGIHEVVSVHGGNGSLYIDSDLIEVEYGTSANKAKKVAKVLKKEVARGELTLDGVPAE